MDGIWEEASVAQYLTDDDFEAEFGRPRTEEEQAAHDMFNNAVKLAHPDTTLSASEGDGTQGGEEIT